MSKRVTGKIGNYPCPTIGDYDNFWFGLDEEDHIDEPNFVLQVCQLCERYANQLVDYEKRFEDDGK